MTSYKSKRDIEKEIKIDSEKHVRVMRLLRRKSLNHKLSEVERDLLEGRITGGKVGLFEGVKK
jgi:hypothetical protein